MTTALLWIIAWQFTAAFVGAEGFQEWVICLFGWPLILAENLRDK